MYFFSSSRVKVLETLLKQKPYSPFLILTNHTEVMTHKKNRPVDKILDLTCPGKQLAIIYLHLISYRTNNSSFYAYFCKTAIVIRYLYISRSSTCEEHGAKPLVSGWLMVLCLCHMQPPAGLEVGRGTDTSGCSTSVGCFSPPFPSCSVRPNSWRGAVVMH